MKKRIVYGLLALVILCAAVLGIRYGVEAAKAYIMELAVARVEADAAAEKTQPETATQVQTAPVDPPAEQTAPPTEQTQPPAEETQPPTEETLPDVYTFTEEEATLLLKLGMAERGATECTECIALVMCTVLNRVEAEKFSGTIRGVIYAQDQFTPAGDGSLEKAVPNAACQEALSWIRKGWDESQGAYYYEWCEGESWHSKNLNLLFQHCDVRFYK